ncbi:hypothetical protein SCHPADRAFT_895456 [Schizopora paradoxa]|uniref:Uncharacterized protein n=1 Tax=Schizopora paradoxa TaxID=27342 RepID=A0A0H2R3P9_9AGAM|nr:hypothetical protein SCHPADRAFT_895456 [Schizopora paradoxa]
MLTVRSTSLHSSPFNVPIARRTRRTAPQHLVTFSINTTPAHFPPPVLRGSLRAVLRTSERPRPLAGAGDVSEPVHIHAVSDEVPSLRRAVAVEKEGREWRRRGRLGGNEGRRSTMSALRSRFIPPRSGVGISRRRMGD